jgi:hypothetical protein
MSAMRQSDVYDGNWKQLYSPGLQQTLKNQYVVTDLDRVNALSDSTKQGPAKLREKKGILQGLVISRVEIMQRLQQT